MFFAPIVISFE